MTGARPQPLPVQPDDTSDGPEGAVPTLREVPALQDVPTFQDVPARQEPALLGPAEVRALAERLGVRPTKQLGQNFVIDPNTIRRIVRAAGLRPDDTVVEVGPGLGSLTLGLLGAARRVVAIEIDPVLAAALPETVAERVPGGVSGTASRDIASADTASAEQVTQRFELVQ